MKKFFIPLLLVLVIPVSFSCNPSRIMGYVLNQQDAASAIRQMLEIGTKNNIAGAFSKEEILTTLFPEPVKKALNTLNMLGLTGEIDRFTNTLSTAAEQTAQASVPVFVSSINSMTISDAIRIVKNGGTSATDYLRTNAGDSLRKSITPIMQFTLDEYKLNDQWKQIIKPVQSLVGNKVNIDLPNLMAGLVAEAMFRKIAENEIKVRTEASARTTTLLQKVFSKNWN